MELIWILLGLFNLLTLFYLSLFYKLLVLGLSIFYIVWDLGLLTSPKFSKANFRKSEIYYYDFFGNYRNIGYDCQQICLLKEKFKLSSKYKTFGIYYDNPKVVDPEKCRAVVGIIRDISSETSDQSEISKECFEYLNEKSYKKAELPSTPSVYSSSTYKIGFSMIIAIMKFYSSLTKNLKDEDFKRSFDIDEKKFKCSVEIYSSNQIDFYIPVKNHDRFQLHSTFQSRDSINSSNK